MGDMETKFPCSLILSIYTGYWHALGEMYHLLLVLWRQLVRFRPVLRIDINVFQCFDHCLTEGHLRGTLWSLVGKPRREPTSGQTSKGHAADMRPSYRNWWRAMYLSIEQVRSQFPWWGFGTFLIEPEWCDSYSYSSNTSSQGCTKHKT